MLQRLPVRRVSSHACISFFACQERREIKGNEPIELVKTRCSEIIYAFSSNIMRSSLFFLLCSGLLALVAGFTKEDHEIFRLKDEIAAFEGSEVTFYGMHSSPSSLPKTFLLTHPKTSSASNPPPHKNKSQKPHVKKAARSTPTKRNNPLSPPAQKQPPNRSSAPLKRSPASTSTKPPRKARSKPQSSRPRSATHASASSPKSSKARAASATTTSSTLASPPGEAQATTTRASAPA